MLMGHFWVLLLLELSVAFYNAEHFTVFETPFAFTAWLPSNPSDQALVSRILSSAFISPHTFSLSHFTPSSTSVNNAQKHYVAQTTHLSSIYRKVYQTSPPGCPRNTSASTYLKLFSITDHAHGPFRNLGVILDSFLPFPTALNSPVDSPHN